MEFDELKSYLMGKRGAEMDFPFGFDTMVFKIMGKIFALIPLSDSPLRVNLKCDPEAALLLRSLYAAVLPGYHMNKRHWNTVLLDSTIPEIEIQLMIDQSYDLVLKGLRRTDREKLLQS